MAEYFEKSCHALHVNERIFFNTSDEPYRHTLCVRFYFCFVTDSTDNNDRTVHSSTARSALNFCIVPREVTSHR